MTQVVFDLRDFAGVSWDVGTVPVVTFRASRPSVSPHGAFAADVTVAPGPDGSVSVELEPTVGMLGLVTYSMELSWVSGGVARRAFWDYRLQVPERADAVPLMDLIATAPHELYEVIEFSAGTTIDGQPVPHSSKTTIWFRDEGTEYRHMIRSEA